MSTRFLRRRRPRTPDQAGGGPGDAAADPGRAEADGAASPKGRRRRRWLRRRWVKVLLVLFLLGILAVAGGVAYLWQMPFPKARPRPQATIVYDTKGHIVATFAEQDRVDVPLSRVPQVVIDAVVSTEDRNFFHEGGVDVAATARAAFADLTGRHLQGGSTITQQYVKNLYLTPQRSLIRKIKEAAYAVRLANSESKQKILDGYLNTIYWGRSAYGIEAASRAYFGKDVSKLGLPEASLLAALIKDPGGSDPADHPGLARTEQTATLKAMLRDHKITAAQEAAVEKMPFSSYVTAPPSQVSKAQSADLGDAYFVAAVRQELDAKYGPQMVDSGGLRVTTTLDPTLQRAAYQTLYGPGPQALDPARGDPSAALVSVDDNGAVRALVGGQGDSTSRVDLALGRAGGGSGRQAGSTFKAFMLAAVIKGGYSVQSSFPVPPKLVVLTGSSGGQPWTVTNYEHEVLPPSMTITEATALSVNTVYAQLVARLGATKLDAMATAMGIDPAELRGAYDSQVLGSAEVSPLEMAAAYATLADGGVYHHPLLVTKVIGPGGKALPLPVKAASRRVLTPTQAAIETYVLHQVVTSGTGTAAGGLSSPVAGKTGTTQYAGDAWFDGYTSKLSTALWMGYAGSTKTMDGFRGVPLMAGGAIPAELWHDYMAAALSAEPGYGGPLPPTPPLTGKTLQPLPIVGDQLVVGGQPGPPVTSYSPATAPWSPPPAPSPTSAPPPSAAPATAAPPTTSPPAPAPAPAPAPTTTSPPPPTTSPPTTTAPPPTTSPPAPTTTTATQQSAASGTTSGSTCGSTTSSSSTTCTTTSSAGA